MLLSVVHDRAYKYFISKINVSQYNEVRYVAFSGKPTACYAPKFKPYLNF